MFYYRKTSGYVCFAQENVQIYLKMLGYPLEKEVRG